MQELPQKPLQVHSARYAPQIRKIQMICALFMYLKAIIRSSIKKVQATLWCPEEN